MKLPRDISGTQLAQLLQAFGYTRTRQTGSHIRLTTTRNGEHHLTIPNHNPVRIGTLSRTLTDVAEHFGLSRDDLQRQLFP